MPAHKKARAKLANNLDRVSTSSRATPRLPAAETVWEYRATFNYPLTRVNANVRHYIKKAGCEVVVAQRLKCLPRIIEKLVRYPRMRLTQMQDVGGCRAVLPDQRAVAIGSRTCLTPSRLLPT